METSSQFNHGSRHEHYRKSNSIMEVRIRDRGNAHEIFWKFTHWSRKYTFCQKKECLDNSHSCITQRAIYMHPPKSTDEKTTRSSSLTAEVHMKTTKKFTHLTMEIQKKLPKVHSFRPWKYTCKL
jgi:hypothetical protein